MNLEILAYEADCAGVKSKRQHKWFRAGYEACERNAIKQIRGLVESYSEDLRMRQCRIDQARAERDEARAECDELKNRQMVPEGYVLLAESSCTLDPEDSVVTYRIVKEDEWNEQISVFGECCEERPRKA